MSTSAVSSASLSQQLEQYFQTRRGDLQQLGQALAQGNLSGAQTAYNNIVTLGQSGPSSTGAPFLNSTREQDFTAIGQALQSGDLAGAQQAFASLRNTAVNQQGTQSESSSSTGPEIVLNLSGGSNSSPEQITINLSPSSGSSGGEQITIGVGSQGSTPSQEITLNLGANSNEQIVLNLLGTTSSATSATSGSNVNVSA